MSKIKIDLKVLEKLWDGKLFIAEQCCPQDEQYKALIREADSTHKNLLDLVEKDNRIHQLLDLYEQQTTAIAEKEHLEAFKKGFALAVSMAAEILVNKPIKN